MSLISTSHIGRHYAHMQRKIEDILRMFILTLLRLDGSQSDIALSVPADIAESNDVVRYFNETEDGGRSHRSR